MTFNWDTGFYDAGTYDITITVQDDSSTHYEPTGEDTDSVTITVTIANLNREPVIDPLSDMTVTEEELIDFVLSFDDPDADDTISLSVEKRAEWSVVRHFDRAIRLDSVEVAGGDALRYQVLGQRRPCDCY
ncbi:MAG: hypothetical protein U5N86_05010 [Planctomycetota bacterium]|nr:hypothetical protein [Planctomycetota bacterium]